MRKILKLCKRIKTNNENITIRFMSFMILIIFISGGILNKAALGNTKRDTYRNNMINLIVESENKYILANAQEEPDGEEQKDDEEIIHKQLGSDMKKEDDEISEMSKKGKEYSYDAREIFKKLKNGDYSNNSEKIVFLTFDDGASNTVTPKVLEILKKYDVKATFFIVGQVVENGGEKAKALVKQEYDEGHAIGNHSYSHNYKVLYPGGSLNLQQFVNEYNKNAEFLKSILGEDFSTNVIRCPGGYMSWKNMSSLDKYLEENNMSAIDWNALSGDAEGKPKNAQELVDYSIKTSADYDIVVLLMHDTYSKEETAKSLPGIIEYFKNKGYRFMTLS